MVIVSHTSSRKERMVWGRFRQTRAQLGGRDRDLECGLDLEAWYPLVLALPLHEKHLGLGGMILGFCGQEHGQI